MIWLSKSRNGSDVMGDEPFPVDPFRVEDEDRAAFRADSVAPAVFLRERPDVGMIIFHVVVRQASRDVAGSPINALDRHDVVSMDVSDDTVAVGQSVPTSRPYPVGVPVQELVVPILKNPTTFVVGEVQTAGRDVVNVVDPLLGKGFHRPLPGVGIQSRLDSLVVVAPQEVSGLEPFKERTAVLKVRRDLF